MSFYNRNKKAEAFIEIAKELMGEEHYEDAHSYIVRAIRLDNKVSEYFFKNAECLTRLGREDEACGELFRVNFLWEGEYRITPPKGRSAAWI